MCIGCSCGVSVCNPSLFTPILSSITGFFTLAVVVFRKKIGGFLDKFKDRFGIELI